MSVTKTGVVRVYNTALKRGLIKCDDGSSDIPVYGHTLEKFGMPSLKTGESVIFEVERVGNTQAILTIAFLELD